MVQTYKLQLPDRPFQISIIKNQSIPNTFWQPFKVNFCQATVFNLRFIALHAETNEQKERAVAFENLKEVMTLTKHMNIAFTRTSPRIAMNEKPNHSTIYEAERHRTDFERLCSNHTIKQYEAYVKKMRQELKGQIPREFPPIKFRQESNTAILKAAKRNGLTSVLKS